MYDEAGELVAIEGIAREIDDPTRRPGETIRLFPGLRINLSLQRVFADGKLIHLTPFGVQAPRTPHLSARRGVRPRGNHAPPLAERPHRQPTQLRDPHLHAQTKDRTRPALPGAHPHAPPARLHMRARSRLTGRWCRSDVRGTRKARVSGPFEVAGRVMNDFLRPGSGSRKCTARAGPLFAGDSACRCYPYASAVPAN